jgi:molybdopterin converting factor small subunit
MLRGMRSETIQLQVALYGPLRPIAGQQHLLTVAVPSPASLDAALHALLVRVPALRPELVDATGRPLPYVHLFVNGRDHQFLTDGMNTPLHASDRIDIFPATAGG